jgi:hypothetical protein
MVRAGCEALFESNYRLDSTVRLEDVVANKREAFWYDCRKRAAACEFARAQKLVFAAATRDGGKRLHRSIFNAAIKACCGISTLPNCRIFFLPAFCFSKSLRLRVTSPP